MVTLVLRERKVSRAPRGYRAYKVCRVNRDCREYKASLART